MVAVVFTGISTLRLKPIEFTVQSVETFPYGGSSEVLAYVKSPYRHNE
jgi:hypothetical protein